MSENKDGLNICLMNDSFPPVIDGVATTILNYAEIINEKLGKATVVTPEYPGVQDDFPFPVVRYPSLSVTEKICSYRMGYPFSASKLDSLTGSGFNIIHTHCPFASMVMARVLRIKTGIPMVFTYHTKFDIDIRRALPTKLMQDQAIKLLVSNISAADEVWTVSEGARQNLLDLGYVETNGHRIRIMENGVDFPRGRAEKDEVESLRADLDLSGHGPVFLFVGRLLWYKGIRTILDSLKILDQRGTDFRMMVVGDGADREEIENYTQELGLGEKVVFTGAVYDREELRTYYTAGDLFIFPSLYDTNGIVVREAAACGVPVGAHQRKLRRGGNHPSPHRNTGGQHRGGNRRGTSVCGGSPGGGTPDGRPRDERGLHVMGNLHTERIRPLWRYNRELPQRCDKQLRIRNAAGFLRRYKQANQRSPDVQEHSGGVSNS